MVPIAGVDLAGGETKYEIIIIKKKSLMKRNPRGKLKTKTALVAKV